MIKVTFTKLFIGGLLAGIEYTGCITFVDTWHAEDWLRGVSLNTLNGKLDYILTEYQVSTN